MVKMDQTRTAYQLPMAYVHLKFSPCLQEKWFDVPKPNGPGLKIALSKYRNFLRFYKYSGHIS
jgi:hypothetical protein